MMIIDEENTLMPSNLTKQQKKKYEKKIKKEREENTRMEF